MDDTKTRVLKAAGPVFADAGYQGATVRKMCQQAKVNVASVNYYFGDKRQLYIETVRLARQQRAAEVPLPDWAPETAPEIRLRDFIHTMVQRMIGAPESPWQTRLMMREILEPTEACEAMVHEYFRPQFDLLLGILAELCSEPTPTHQLRQVGYSIIGQCLYYRVAGKVVRMMTPDAEYQQHYEPAELADHIWRFTAAAVRLSPERIEKATTATTPSSVRT